jgi:hypothetical protein
VLKELLLDEIARRLEQMTACSELFTVRWRRCVGRSGRAAVDIVRPFGPVESG